MKHAIEEANAELANLQVCFFFIWMCLKFFHKLFFKFLQSQRDVVKKSVKEARKELEDLQVTMRNLDNRSKNYKIFKPNLHKTLQKNPPNNAIIR